MILHLSLKHIALYISANVLSYVLCLISRQMLLSVLQNYAEYDIGRKTCCYAELPEVGHKYKVHKNKVPYSK